MRRCLALAVCLFASCWLAAQELPDGVLPVRKSEQVPQTYTLVKDGKVITATKTVAVQVHYSIKSQPEKSAIIICDMWDNHWCASAAKRCDVLAKKAGPIIDTARKNGMTIIHCPSDTMKFYAEHASRKRAKETKVSKLPEEKKLPDPKLPIDDKDGGCDDDPAPASFRAWIRQHEAIKIDADKDYITDVGTEVYNILADRKIDRVFVMGVHTNMCVLHRSFAIKQLKRWGVECYLVRDITDTMYNPKSAPFVAHDKGTELVIEFIETHWCPTVLSTDILKK
jgi:nicotinamidase-related amidase